MKELYSKKEVMGLLGIGREKLASLIKADALQMAGRYITRTSLERILGHPLEAQAALVVASTKETEGPREQTPLEQMRERKQLAVETEEVLRLESEIEKYTEQQTILIDLTLQERDLLDQCIETSAELFDQDSRLQRKIATERTLVRQTIPAAQAEAVEITAKAEAVAEGIITEAQAKADSLVAAAKRKAAPVAIQPVVPLSMPSKEVYRGREIPEETGHEVITWVVGILVVGAVLAVAVWLFEPGLKELFNLIG